MTSTSIAIFLAILFTATNAVPYSKYGRTCKDIGCRSDEVCVMAEDPCSLYQRDSCGRYPTCQRSSGGGESCTTKICPSGQYCKTENGRPTCVNTTPGLGYDSAGISAVNGQRVNNNQPSVPADPSQGSRYASNDPYANANAPPAEEVNGHNNQPSFNNNPANPPYPMNNNGQNLPYPTNNGHLPYPTNNNNGYPPYPQQPPNNNNNKPGVPVDQYGYPIYPRQDNKPNYHNTYPQHNLPQHNPGWSNTYPNSIHRRNGSSINGASTIVLIGSFVMCILSFRISNA